MKKLLIVPFLLLLGAWPSHAQTTVVTGTIVDPNNNAYANGTASAQKVVTSGQPNVPPITVTTNSVGLFSFSGATNALLSPASYVFTVCATPTLLGKPNTNPTPTQVCFVSGPIAISGASQDISTTLNAIAVVLGPQQSVFSSVGINGNLIKATGSNTAGDSGIAASNVPLLNGANAYTGAESHSNTETFTGLVISSNGITSSATNDQFKSLESVKYADQFAAATVAAPVNAPGVLNTATGGSVAANTYACEVTFNGGTTGETTASPASATTITGGATSTLFCAPNDASISGGAATYNVYWQTGGAGSYWKGHASVVFGTMDSQTTTPATSGTNPPVSNTATSIIAGASAAAGIPGSYVIPSNVSTSAGSPGDPAAPASIFDYRYGSANYRCTLPPAYMTQSGATMNNCVNIWVQPPILGTRQQTNCIQASMILGTPTWGNTSPIPAGNCAFFGAYRFGTRTELAGALTNVCYATNQNGVLECNEDDINNASGSDATNANGGVGKNEFCVGANRCWGGVNVAPQGAGTGFAGFAYNSGDGNTPTAISLGASCIALAAGLCPANSVSQVINIISVSSGGARQAFTIGEDAFGNALLEPSSGNVVVQKGGSQQANLIFANNTALRNYTFPDIAGNTVIDVATQTLTNKTLNVPLTSGTGLQIFNTTTSCTTAATAFVTCTTAAISLPVAEADTSYRIVCTPHGPTNFPLLVATTISSAAQFTITIEATTAAAATFASYDCIAGHN